MTIKKISFLLLYGFICWVGSFMRGKDKKIYPLDGIIKNYQMQNSSLSIKTLRKITGK
jgi:hypothetical protein